jgi:hypothetical protein
MPGVLHCQLLSAFGLHASRQLADGRGVSRQAFGLFTARPLILC